MLGLRDQKMSDSFRTGQNIKSSSTGETDHYR